MRTWLLALLLAAPAAAQFEGAPEEVAGQAVAPVDDAELVRRMREKLAEPGVADSFAVRLNNSMLAARLSAAGDEAARLQEIRRWIDEHPDEAASIALGLARDEAEGTRRFEQALATSVRTRLVVNPGSKKGIFGNLKKSGVDSKLLKKDAEMSDEERREILKTMFEGQGSMSGKIITQEEKERAPKDGPGGLSVGAGYYDRLSHANLRGYSPQLQALQSQLNRLGVPGAPRLIETGKLDYETLRYPAYPIRHDIAGLERRLRLERNFALARALGLDQGLTEDKLLDPDFEARLLSQAAGKSLSPRFAKRQQALERAAAALRAFEAAAAAAKDPSRIARALLVELGSKQKEASRWITAASLEEELERLEAESGFLSPELRDAVSRCPVVPADQAAYLRRGEEFQKRHAALRSNDEDAVRILESDAWTAQLPAVERLLAANGPLRLNLARNVSIFVKTPFRLAPLGAPKPRWRELLDSHALRLLPSLAYSRRLKAVEREKALLKDVFFKIAAGDLEAAHAILASYEPSSAPPPRR